MRHDLECMVQGQISPFLQSSSLCICRTIPGVTWLFAAKGLLLQLFIAAKTVDDKPPTLQSQSVKVLGVRWQSVVAV